MNNKAISAVFSWIFILIAGALIITVFTIIATQTTTGASERAQLQALQNVNTILHTQQTTGDVETNVNIPHSNLQITCEAIRDNNEIALINQLQIGGFTQSLENQLIVGRNQETNRLNLFSKKLRLPFEVGTVLYVSSFEEELFIQGEERLQREFNEILPRNINNQTGEIPTNLATRNTQNKRVVYLGGNPPTPTTTPGVTYMHVQPNNNDVRVEEHGTIRYYENNQWSQSYTYVGETMLLAYIWQADTTRADCLQHQLAQRLQAQISLQLTRVGLLRQAYERTTCAGKINRAPLDDLNRAIKPDSGEAPLYDFSDLYDAIERLERHNRQIDVGERCATIY